MSYRREDHIPDHLNTRKCYLCAERFTPEHWWQKACNECLEEKEKEEENNEDEDGGEER